VHRALGIDTARFQDIYHFTAGKAVIDTRLGSEEAYAHLAKRAGVLSRPESPSSRYSVLSSTTAVE